MLKNVVIGLLAYLLLVLLYWPGLNAELYLDSIRLTELMPPANWKSLLHRRWIVDVTFYIDRELWGFDFSLWRVVNIGLHIINAVLLLLLLKLIFRFRFFRQIKKVKYVEYLLVGLWLVHPIHYSVTLYVVQRYEILATTFSILSMYMFLLMSIRRNMYYAIVFLVSMFFGVMCKLTVISVPLAALAVTWPLLHRTINWYFRKYSYLILLSCASLIVFVGLKTNWGMMFFADNGGTVGFQLKITPWEYFAGQAKMMLWYLADILFPFFYVFDMHLRLVKIDSLIIFFLAMQMTALTICAYVAIRKKYKFPAFMLAAYCLVLPTSSVMPLADMYFHHRVYMASFWVLLAALILICHKRVSNLGPVKIQLTLFCLLLLLAGRTVHRSAQYGDARHIYAESLRFDPCHPRALMWHAETALNKRRDAESLEYIKQAIHCQNRYGYSSIFITISDLLTRMGRTDYAIQALENALTGNVKEELTLGQLLVSSYMRYGQFNLAIKKSSELLEKFESDSVLIYFTLTSLIELGEYDAALKYCREIKLEDDLIYISKYLALKSGSNSLAQDVTVTSYLDAYFIGRYLYEDAQYELAIDYLSKSLELQPGYRDSIIFLAKAQIKSGVSLDQAKQRIDGVIRADIEERLDSINALLLYWHKKGDQKKVAFLRALIEKIIRQRAIPAALDMGKLQIHYFHQ